MLYNVTIGRLKNWSTGICFFWHWGLCPLGSDRVGLSVQRLWGQGRKSFLFNMSEHTGFLEVYTRPQELREEIQIWKSLLETLIGNYTGLLSRLNQEASVVVGLTNGS